MPEPIKLNGTERSAVLILALGERKAADVLRQMEPKEVQRIGAAMTRLGNISRDQINAVLGEFGLAIQSDSMLTVGVEDYLRNVMVSALGEQKARGILDRVLDRNDDTLGNLKWMDPKAIAATGPKGNITKADAMNAIGAASAPAPAAKPAAPAAPRADQPREERVKMTRLRQTIARRLKESQNTAAQLTTFNEVDMTNVMALRSQYKDAFEKRHGVKLGFMSFFTKAIVAALKEIPSVNAEIDGTDIIYKNHYDIGVAVGTEKGLVVPVLRDADTLTLAGIEKGIAALGKAARDGDLTLDQLQGGTFTITNGGTYGSLMSTPILNAPQSGILGMHNIVQRPMAIDGQVVIRPMMYLALSYDHRLVDGKEAVTFLVRVKELLEDPARALLDL